VNRDSVLHPELDRPDLQNLGASDASFQHFLVTYAFDLARAGTTLGSAVYTPSTSV